MIGTVLVVDDDPLVHVVSQSLFEARGVAEVRTALCGGEAIEVVRDRGGDIDLIQCDLNMPDMDGLQVMRHLAELRYPGAIVIVSGEDGSILKAAQNLARAHGLYLVGRLRKPLRADDLDRLLADLRPAERRERRSSTLAISPTDIRAAIRCGEIEAHYQPKIDLRTGLPCGAEALARWHHPEEGFIPPSDFIPVAEANGLIGDLTWCILDQALNVTATATRMGRRLQMAVNTDADTVNELSFPDRVAKTVRAAGVDFDQITLELTERGLLEEGACQIEVLARLRMMRFDISIDDFGTGTSNIKQLCSFPFSELKIDKSFLTDFDSDRTRRVCLQAVVSLARALDLRTVIEGVETQEQLDLVRDLDIDLAQGFLFAKAMPADRFLQWLEEWTRDLPGQSTLRVSA